MRITRLQKIYNRWLRFWSPGYSWCSHRGKPWNHTEHHSTDFGNGTGGFPLCEKCWGGLTIEERLPYYRELWESWSDYGEPHVTWEEVERAVRSGK